MAYFYLLSCIITSTMALNPLKIKFKPRNENTTKQSDYSAKVSITYWNVADLRQEIQSGNMAFKAFYGVYGANSQIAAEYGLVVHVRDSDNRTHGCLPPVNAPLDEPWIALIQRGKCKFQRKIFHATKTANASAVVIYNNRPGTLVMQHGIDDEVSVFMRKKDGEFIAKVVDSGYRVMMNISENGQIQYGSPTSKVSSVVIIVAACSSVLLLVAVIAVVSICCIRRAKSGGGLSWRQTGWSRFNNQEDTVRITPHEICDDT